LVGDIVSVDEDDDKRVDLCRDGDILVDDEDDEEDDDEDDTEDEDGEDMSFRFFVFDIFMV
jgi:hypothetical protein